MFAWFGNLRLRWKVLFAPAFLIIVLISVGAYAIHSQRANQSMVNALMVGEVLQAETVADFTTSAWTAEVHLYRLMATAANETDEKKIKTMGASVLKALSNMEGKLKQLQAVKFTNAKAIANLKKLSSAVATYVKSAKGVIDMAEADAGTALMLMSRTERAFGAIEKLTDDMSEDSKDLRDRKIAVTNLSLERQAMMLVTILLIVVVVGCLASLLIGRGIVNPVLGITSAIKRMAQGEFELALPGLGRKDEIGAIAAAVEELKETAVEKARQEAEEVAARQAREAEEAARQQKLEAAKEAELSAERAKVAEDQTRAIKTVGVGLRNLSEGNLIYRLPNDFPEAYLELKEDFNNTMAQLQEMIRSLVESAKEVSNASAEIATSTTDLSQRTEEQAASLEQTSASMEQISATVKKNAENAQAADQFAAGTHDVANRGGEVVAQAVGAMARIEESSGKISDIIGVIDEIARQTNLLALNAAVEAARAGEAGRGFAVVASEVRSLAQRSSQAAKDIKDLITSSSGQVRDGVELVNKAGASLTEIVESIKKVAEVVSDIAAASAEQASGLDQVNKALTQMDEVTQQNSALVEENAATTKTLEHQAAAMNERVSYFRIGQSTAAKKAPQPVGAVPSAGAGASARAPRRGAVGRMQTALATAFQNNLANEQSQEVSMDFDEAIRAHAQWKAKLRLAIDNRAQMDADALLLDDRCKLGKWLHGEAKAMHGAMPEYQALVERHKAFHLEAGKISQLINARKYAEAEEALGAESAYADRSGAVVSAIRAFKKALATTSQNDADWKEF